MQALSTETHAEIFSLATSTWPRSRISFPPRLSFGNRTSWNDPPFVDENLATKLAITLVCKRWCVLGLTHLFDLFVVDPDKIAKRLSRSGAVEWCEELRMPLAHVRQLRIIDGRRQSSAGEGNTELLRTRFIQFLQLCPNLIEYNYNSVSKLLSVACLEHHGASIRSLEVRNSLLPPNFEIQLASNLPHLEHLTLRDYHRSPSSSPAPVVPFPVLHTLVVRGRDQTVWDVPLLECLSVDSFGDLTTLPPFHSRSMRLRELYLGSEDYVYRFQDMLTDHSSLETLRVECHAFNQLDGWTESCPSLRVVYLSFSAPHYYRISSPRRVTDTMVAALVDGGRFPSLNTVVFCEHHHRLGISEAVWKKWVARLRKIKVSLEHRMR